MTTIGWVLLFCVLVCGAVPAAQVTVEGEVTDAVDGQPIARATVRVHDTGISTLTNEEGRYRLLLSPGNWQVQFSHVSYESQTVSVTLDSVDVTRDIALERATIELPGTTIYSRAYDPAQKIILEAINRKQDILNQLHDYSYDAYVKVVATDLDKSGIESVFAIFESQTTAYWEQPDKYKEVITARRQSGN
jgi:hypothetical protein